MDPPKQLNSTLSTRCYLMELPPELRNQIYSLSVASLTAADVIKVYSHHCEKDNHGVHFYLRPPPLLLASRAIREEALSIYIGAKTLQFELPSCFICHAGECTFDFGILSTDLHHIKLFRVASPRNMTFSINVDRGLSKRHVEWLKPDEDVSLGGDVEPGSSLTKPEAALRRRVLHKDCDKVSEVIDGVVAERGGETKLEVDVMEAIMEILI